MKLRARLKHLTTALTGRRTAPKALARYAGGQHSRIVAQWFADLDDVNQELRCSLEELRARSRQLCRDNGEAAGLLLDFESDIVGAQGARLQFRATRPRGEPIDRLNNRVEAEWAKWCHRDFCTLAGYESFAALQRMVMRTVIMDGEFFALRVRDPDRPWGYALQPLDADQLDTNENRTPLDGVNAIVMGVEIDRDGRPVAYHLWDRHPSLAGRVKRRVLAADVRHVFKRVRPGQVRGIPWFAPALVTWKLGDRYTEAELYQSLLAAAQGGFFVQEDGGGIYETPTDAEGNPVPLVMEAEPGSARALPPGVTFQAWEPKHPTANFSGFMKTIKRVIARAFGRSYASLTGDLSDVNFSSMRTDRVREMAQSRMHQHDILIEQFCAPTFSDWVRMASLVGSLGAVTMSTADLAAYQSWMCTGWAWIDPVKDATAAQMELGMGITSPQRICAEKGRDYYEIIDEIAEAKRYASEKGVNLDVIPLQITVNADAAQEDTPPTTGRVLPLHKGAA